MVTVFAGVLVIVLRRGPVRQLLFPRMLQLIVELVGGELLVIARLIVARVVGPMWVDMLVGMYLEPVEAVMIIAMLIPPAILVHRVAIEFMMVVTILVAAAIIPVPFLVVRDLVAVMQFFPPPMRRCF